MKHPNVVKTQILLPLSMLAVAMSMLVHTSIASASCIPVGRLSPGSHGWAAATGHDWSTFQKIFDKVNSSPWIYDVMGCPMADYSVALDGGAFLFFEHGAVVTEGDPNKPAFAVMGAIYDHWRDLAYERGVMGYPTSDELGTNAGGRVSYFAGGAIVWHAVSGAHRIYGDFLGWWQQNVNKFENFAIFPAGEEFASPGGRGNCPPAQQQQVFRGTPVEGALCPAEDSIACWDANSRQVSLLPGRPCFL